MLRIVVSRAALFPWLGIALMAAGAAFPDGAVAGVVLVVIGANVAFYSLRDFSQNFAWGLDARPMLNLCGLVFLLGLALVAGATLFESLNRWLALLCTGLYLCLFAVWTAQQPVGWPLRVLAIVGTILMILGGIIAHLGWRDWRVFAESQEAPQEIPLSDLQRSGFGANRYIRLKDFRFCERFAVEQPDKEATVKELWIPVIAVDGQAVKRDGPPPSVPPRIRAVVVYPSFGNPGLGRPRFGGIGPFDLLRKNREEGYECTVVTGIKKIKPEVKQQLSELAPQTDFAEVDVLDWRKPGSAERVYGLLGGGGAGFLLGMSALCLVYSRATKVVGAGGWSPPVEASSEEAAAAGQDQPSAEPSAAADGGRDPGSS
jgi:hypothetical protein